MLQIQSFSIKDSDAISQWLKTHRLAAGSNILVTDGYLAFPYEDGMPDTPSLRLAFFHEMKRELESQREPIIHSQKVLQRQIDAYTSDRNALQAELDADTENTSDRTSTRYKKRKNVEEKIKFLDSRISEKGNQLNMNIVEIERVNKNIEIYEESIAEVLSSGTPTSPVL